MDRPDLLGFLAITLSCNVTVVGKIWLVFMVLLRMVVLVLAGSPVYQDEQERFVCNTLQPGCANVCYDIFSPVSHLRFWLLHSVSVLLPSAVFSVYVLHKGAELAARGPRGPDGVPGDHHAPELTPGARRWLPVPDFSSGYLVHLCLRTLTEAAFGALHYLLFGFLVPKRFSCTHPPCTSVVDCYVSRPTEKSILMLFVWAACALSFLLSVADLGQQRPEKTPLTQPEVRDARSLSGTCTRPILLTPVFPNTLLFTRYRRPPGHVPGPWSESTALLSPPSRDFAVLTGAVSCSLWLCCPGGLVHPFLPEAPGPC
ncbi:gap junction delta-4 protein [Camelus ferus]|nr:gap junction delta-4 protein [Camelus ferus]